MERNKITTDIVALPSLKGDLVAIIGKNSGCRRSNRIGTCSRCNIYLRLGIRINAIRAPQDCIILGSRNGYGIAGSLRGIIRSGSGLSKYRSQIAVNSVLTIAFANPKTAYGSAKAVGTAVRSNFDFVRSVIRDIRLIYRKQAFFPTAERVVSLSRNRKGSAVSGHQCRFDACPAAGHRKRVGRTCRNGNIRIANG